MKKKSKKQAKRPYGPRKPSIVIPILNLVRKTKGGMHIKITKHGIFFNADHAEKIGVKIGEFLLVGNLDGQQYIGRKPKGVFGGHLVVKGTAKNSPRLGIKGNLEQYGATPGEYTLGKSIPQTLAGPEGEQIPFIFWELVPV